MVGKNQFIFEFQEWFLSVEKDVNHHSNDIRKTLFTAAHCWNKP